MSLKHVRCNKISKVPNIASAAFSNGVVMRNWNLYLEVVSPSNAYTARSIFIFFLCFKKEIRELNNFGMSYWGPTFCK